MISLIFLILALICFLLVTINVTTSRVNLTGLGLFFYILSLLVGGLQVR